MGMQIPVNHLNQIKVLPTSLSSISACMHSLNSQLMLKLNHGTQRIQIRNEVIVLGSSLHWNSKTHETIRRNRGVRTAASENSVSPPHWDSWRPDKVASVPSLSDVVWPSAGAFLAMAILGKIDQILLPKGISVTIAPLGAVCAVLFATPTSPAARKYNMFMAQIGCAAIGVMAFSLFGSGWLARSTALAASIAFMIYTRCTHPPAASLPILFIDGAKLHRLNFWYAVFPGATGCILLCLIQGMVVYLKENFKF